MDYLNVKMETYKGGLIPIEDEALRMLLDLCNQLNKEGSNSQFGSTSFKVLDHIAALG